MSDTIVKIGVALALIVGILFIIGGIVALVSDLIPAPHILSYEAMTVAIVATAIGVAIILLIAYLFASKKIAT